MFKRFAAFSSQNEAIHHWVYASKITDPFITSMIWVGIMGLTLATLLQLTTGSNPIFLCINGFGALFFLAIALWPRPISVQTKIVFVAAYFCLQILTSFTYSGLLGSGEVMIALFVVIIVIALKPLAGVLLSSLAVSSVFLFAVFLEMELIYFPGTINLRHNATVQWLVQGIVMVVFSVFTVSLINYLRSSLLATIADLEASNRSLIQLNRELEQTKNQISTFAYTDQLTQLPNRPRFQEYVMGRIDAGVSQAFLVLLELKNFRMINTLYDTDYGDRVLLLIGRSLGGKIKADRFIARLEGVEFAVWVEGAKKGRLKAEVEQMIEEATALLEEEMDFGQDLQFTRVAVHFPVHGESYQELMRAGSAALKAGKERPENSLLFFDANMMQSVEDELAVRRLLERAVQNNEFSVVYQPKVNIKTNETEGVEALTRWTPAELGSIAPKLFIGLLTKQGLIVDFAKQTIKQILSDVPRLLARFHSNLKVSINISPVMFLEHDFVSYISSTLEAYNVQPNTVILEITEDVFVDEPRKIRQVFTELHRLGIGVSLDDFGKGYSSLSYISSFDFSELKVDRQFTRDIAESEKSFSLFQTICAIAEIYNYRIVAEGVENAKQLETLMQTRCDLAQGNYFARPKAIE